MTESRATRLRSARNFGEMEISTRRSIWRGPFCAVFGFCFTEINFTTNVAGFFAANIAVFNVVFNYVSSTKTGEGERGGGRALAPPARTITTTTLLLMMIRKQQHCAGWRFTD